MELALVAVRARVCAYADEERDGNEGGASAGGTRQAYGSRAHPLKKGTFLTGITLRHNDLLTRPIQVSNLVSSSSSSSEAVNRIVLIHEIIAGVGGLRSCT